MGFSIKISESCSGQTISLDRTGTIYVVCPISFLLDIYFKTAMSCLVGRKCNVIRGSAVSKEPSINEQTSLHKHF